MAEAGMLVVQIDWVANPFRGDKFEAAWAPAAEAVLDYGATAYAFFRQKDDPLGFTQLAWFEDKMAFERYWLSEEISDVRAEASGLYQVPLVPVWHTVVGAGSLEPEDAVAE